MISLILKSNEQTTNKQNKDRRRESRMTARGWGELRGREITQRGSHGHRQQRGDCRVMAIEKIQLKKRTQANLS